MIDTSMRGESMDPIMEGHVFHNQGRAQQKVWLAVLDGAIADWVRGAAMNKCKAEFFLFEDQDDFPFVCRSAGLSPESVRDSLWEIRARTFHHSSRNVA
jgi:hypothetical protein